MRFWAKYGTRDGSQIESRKMFPSGPFIKQIFSIDNKSEEIRSVKFTDETDCKCMSVCVRRHIHRCQSNVTDVVTNGLNDEKMNNNMIR